MPFVAEQLAQNSKWAYMMSLKFNLDSIRRDLCRTSENKEAKYCPLQGFSVFDQMDIGDVTHAQTVL